MYGVNVLFHNVEETHRKQLTRYLVAYPLISIFICFESACSSFLLRRKVLLEHNSHLSDILWTLPKMANNTKNSSEGKISPRMPSTPGWDTDRFLGCSQHFVRSFMAVYRFPFSFLGERGIVRVKYLKVKNREK